MDDTDEDSGVNEPLVLPTRRSKNRLLIDA
jgi:hypothetical protein